MYGRCDQQLGLSYQPWIDVLTHLVVHAPGSLLAEHVATCGGHVVRLVPDLAQRVQPLVVSANDPVDERYLLFGAVADLLERMAALSRLVVVLDDLVAVVGDHMWAAKKGLAALAISWNEGANARVNSANAFAEVGSSRVAFCAIAIASPIRPVSDKARAQCVYTSASFGAYFDAA